jgi:hypothetical protein
VADGSYGAQTFEDPDSGTSVITIRKATVSDHGTNAGWQNAYGDESATFSSLIVLSNYMVIDGQVGQWAIDLPGYVPYGFRVLRRSQSANERAITLGGPSNAKQGITLRHIEAAFTNTPRARGQWSTGQDIIHMTAGNVTLEHCWLHDAGRANMILNQDTLTVDSCVLERNGQAQVAEDYNPSEHSELFAIHPNADNVTIRRSYLRDWRSTGGIILFDNNRNFRFYGNVATSTGYFATPSEANDANGIVNARTAAVGVQAYVYNNTFVDMTYGASVLSMGTYDTREVKNNIFFNVRHASGSALTIGGTRSHNWYYNSGSHSESNIQNGTGDPFHQRSARDYRLNSATDAGLNLGQPYSQDIHGIVRGGDGRWDRGAFEYSGQLTRLPAPPTNLRILR